MRREVVMLGIISLALMATALVYVDVATAQVVTDGLISYWTLDDDYQIGTRSRYRGRTGTAG